MAGQETRTRNLLALGSGILVLLLLGAIIAPHLVYDQFIWKYFWGPIVADAGTGSLATCPPGAGMGTEMAVACQNGVVAHSGYTVVNEFGYGIILIYLLTLLVTVMERLRIGTERNFIIYFIPFILSGGLLRVVEDVATTHTGLLQYPLRYFLISPLIYLSMFGIVFTTILIGVYVQRKNLVQDYRHVVLIAGIVMGTALTAVILHETTTAAGWMFPATVGGAALILGAYGALLRTASQWYPPLRSIISCEGITVLYGHLLDGVSTSLSIGILAGGDIGIEKHPVPQMLMKLFGTPYAFIGVKLLVVSMILYYMNDELRSEEPLFFNLILLGILSVGMGPGIRNMTRAVFGV